MAIIKELLNTVPVNILIDQNIVLHWHCRKSHNLSAIAITCTDFSQSIHCQFFILVHVQFVTKIVSMVRIGIGLPSSVGISLDLVQRRDNWKKKLFQCACHQLLYHNWPYILSQFFYPMWVQPWVKHIKNLIWYISTVFEMDTFGRHLQVANLKSVHPIESWLVKRE